MSSEVILSLDEWERVKAEIAGLRREIERLKEHFAKQNAQDVEKNRRLRADTENREDNLRKWIKQAAEMEAQRDRLTAALEEIASDTTHAFNPQTEIARKALKV